MSELCTPFIDRDRMTYYVRTASCSIREPAALHPCILECRHAVDCIKKTKEAYGFYRAAECLPERAHEFEKL